MGNYKILNVQLLFLNRNMFVFFFSICSDKNIYNATYLLTHCLYKDTNIFDQMYITMKCLMFIPLSRYIQVFILIFDSYDSEISQLLSSLCTYERHEKDF